MEVSKCVVLSQCETCLGRHEESDYYYYYYYVVSKGGMARGPARAQGHQKTP